MNHKAKALELILAERHRQIAEEGYTPEMDDLCIGHELMIAGACYERDPDRRERKFLAHCWPFDKEAWKPTAHLGREGRIRELVKAGALFTAELDRLNRINKLMTPHKAAAKRRIERVIIKLALHLQLAERKEAIHV